MSPRPLSHGRSGQFQADLIRWSMQSYGQACLKGPLSLFFKICILELQSVTLPRLRWCHQSVAGRRNHFPSLLQIPEPPSWDAPCSSLPQAGIQILQTLDHPRNVVTCSLQKLSKILSSLFKLGFRGALWFLQRWLGVSWAISAFLANKLILENVITCIKIQEESTIKDSHRCFLFCMAECSENKGWI